MPLFGKKKGGGAGADGPEVEDVVGQGWGIRGAHGQLMDKSGNTIANKGDNDERAFRKKTSIPYQVEQRKYFNSQLAKLRSGYESALIKTPEGALSAFTVGETLGTGSFGRVLMVTRTAGEKGHNYMAMKIISKDRVVKTRQTEHTFNEKNILFSMDSRFIVKLYDYFCDSKSIYMNLEFINGGEMFTHIQKQKGRRFSGEIVRFFAAETVLAFEYLHNLDIIFRDLKPENMLIDARGHIRLTDFGFAKRVEDKTWTMCGTPEYLAPEIIVNKGYNHAVDWWAVGVLIYEMLCGRSPFEARSQLEMFKKISGRKYSNPSHFDEGEKDLIGKLLQVDITMRLGNLHNGTQAIKDHKYFQPGFQGRSKDEYWDGMNYQTIDSPYKPAVKGPDDCSQFDKYPEEKVKWVNGVDQHEKSFEGF